MRHFLTLLIILLAAAGLPVDSHGEVTVGAARTSEYLPLLKGKRVALLSNHTGMVGTEHTLDLMLRSGVNVTTIFSPEHGFRGNADAGEHVGSGKDAKTGIPIASLYDGRTRMPSKRCDGQYRHYRHRHTGCRPEDSTHIIARWLT